MKMMMILLISFLSSHPSMMCLSLVTFCLMMSLYLKSLVMSINLYLVLIIFIGGILLLLFYLTMMSVNKPSWYINFLFVMLLMPEFYMSKNLKFSSSSLFLESLNDKFIFLFILFILLFMLYFIYFVFCKIMFMRQLN